MATGTSTRHVLIVEDEPLVAMQLEDLLIELGHSVVGIATRMEHALRLALAGDIDLAILDVNVAGVHSFPVAEIMRQRGIPFIFATGYGADGLVDGYRNELVLSKPYDAADLESTIAKAISTLKAQ